MPLQVNPLSSVAGAPKQPLPTEEPQPLQPDDDCAVCCICSWLCCGLFGTAADNIS